MYSEGTVTISVSDVVTAPLIVNPLIVATFAKFGVAIFYFSFFFYPKIIDNTIDFPVDVPLEGASSHATPLPVDVINCPSEPCPPLTLKFSPSIVAASTNGVVTEVTTVSASASWSPVTWSSSICLVYILLEAIFVASTALSAIFATASVLSATIPDVILVNAIF